MDNEPIPQNSGQVTAIMVTGGIDLATRMVGDRAWTLDLIERDRNFMQEQCTYFQGQVLAYTDDGLLACFGSAVESVRCALEIQLTFIRATANMQPRDVLSHVIGIHWGEISITAQNLSGSGIAIATSLKSEVNAGTIGISQPIYDLVRSSLPISISYLGQKQMQDPSQNINEVLQIYQINPDGQFTAQVNTAQVNFEAPLIMTPPAVNASPSIDIDSVDIHDFNEFEDEYVEPSKELFDEIVLELESHDQVIQVKQLLFYACINKWESDRAKLDRVNLKGLIQELIELTVTFRQLKSLMAELTQTIEPEYTAIATMVIDEVGKLYADYLDQPQDPYDEVVQSLEDPVKDIVLIKRLIFYICQQDLPKAQTLTFKTAIQALRDLYPTLESLRLRLKQVTSMINKPEYTAVVDIIIDDLSSIYPTRSPQPSLPTIIERSTQAQNLTRIPTSSIPVPLVAPAPMIAAYKPDLASSQVSSQLAEPQSVESTEIASDRQTLIAKLELFDLRLEIIKYINPLRAKILIFAILNDTSGINPSENFTAVRTYELDDLLRDLLMSYKTLAELETQLKNSAKRLHESSEYIQAASAIVNAVRPIYEQLNNRDK